MIAPQAFPAPAPPPNRDMAGASGATPRPMAKSRAAANVASFDERVKTIQTLVREARYDDARRELVRLREDYPDRIDALAPELRELLPPR